MAGDEMGGFGTDRKFVGKKAKKRLGGKGLSLDAFVRAKSRGVYNPCEIRKKREFYENAKKVKKYKKLVKQIGDQNRSTEYDSRASQPKDLQEYECMWQKVPQGGGNEKLNHVAGDTSDGGQRFLNCNLGVHRKHKKGLNYLERLRTEYEKRHAEEQKQREDKQKAIAERQEGRLKALQVRKNFQMKMWKKTRSGQPVMKYRLEHILETLQRQQ
eukprot:c22510_g1_i1 orf=470-1111(-)